MPSPRKQFKESSLSKRLRQLRQASDDGFSMVEVIVAIVIIGIVAGAAAGFFASNIRGLNGERQRQAAAQIGNQLIQNVEAVEVQPVNQLVSGRSQSAVLSAFGTAAATRLNLAAQDDETNAGDYDTSSTDPVSVPINATQTVSGTTFSSTTFIDVCWLKVSSGICGPTKSSSTQQEYRASVDVYWTAATPCTTGCAYDTSTIIDPTLAAQFDNNIVYPSLTSMTPTTVVNYNNASTCTTSAGSGSGTEIKMQVANLQANANVKIVAKGGSIVTSTIAEPSATELDFCLVSSDAPGSYTLSVINPDGGSFQTSLTETPNIAKAVWSGGVLTLTGGGLEAGGVLSATGTPWTSYLVTNNGDSSADTVGVNGFTQPKNGAAVAFKLTNPDGSPAATFTVTAPTITTTALKNNSNSTVTDAIAGTNFEAGMTVVATGGCTAPAVTVTSATAAQLAFTTAAAGTCAFTLTNPDSGIATTTVSVVNPPPSVSGVSPAAFVAGQSTVVSLTGSGFLSGMTATVTTGNCTGVSLASITSASAKLTITGGTSGASCTVTLKNTDNQTATLTENTDAAPTVTSIAEQTVVYQGTTYYYWTVKGTNFQTGATVSVASGGTVVGGTANQTISGTTQITFTSNTIVKGNYTVTVTNTDGGNATSASTAITP